MMSHMFSGNFGTMGRFELEGSKKGRRITNLEILCLVIYSTGTLGQWEDLNQAFTRHAM